MATPLILFPLWDVLSGVYVFTSKHAEKLVWTKEDDESIESMKACMNKFLKRQISRRKGGGDSVTAKNIEKVRLLTPAQGALTSESGALLRLLKDLGAACELGVPPTEFAERVRPKIRNGLAHGYAPKDGGGASSLVPVDTDFADVLIWVRNRSEPVATKDGDSWMIDGMAMLRDSERLTSALIKHLRENASEEQCRLATRWLWNS